MGEHIEDGGKHLITRGNLDGIACAAVFLQQFPGSSVSFVTSPPAALRDLGAYNRPVEIYLADIPLTAELAEAMDARERPTVLIDHHPTAHRSEHAIIDLERSAAGVLHAFLEQPILSSNIAALADLYERSETFLLHSRSAISGRQRLEAEAAILDFAWRFNIEDDAFRLDAARSLSHGRWPSEVPLIAERWKAVLTSGRWGKALDQVRTGLEVRGSLGLLDLRGKRRSLQGFGSAALSKVARELDCGYTLMLHDSKDTATASLRSSRADGLDLGRFAEEFTREHGVGGGGHRSSAGARVPVHAADLLIDDLAAAVY